MRLGLACLHAVLCFLVSVALIDGTETLTPGVLATGLAVAFLSFATTAYLVACEFNG